jgi:subtilisin family serine protease
MVWEMIRTKGGGDVLVVLRTQADLSAADALETKGARGRYVYQTLRSVAERSQRDLRVALDAQGVEHQAFYLINALKVRVDRSMISSLAARPEVGRILPNPWIQGVPNPVPQEAGALTPLGVESNIKRVHADDVWSLGHTGQGVVVGGQDTGYQWDHPALQGQYRGWGGTSVDHDYNWHDAIHEDNPNTPAGNPCGFDSPVPCDDHGHGTHTMGTIVGDDGEDNQIGMAPGARWIACRNMEEGWGTPATYLECFEYFLAPYPVGATYADGNPDLAPHIVNNSWHCPPAEGCAPDTLESAVDALRQAGIVVVVSTGNAGSACSTVTDPPAIYKQSLSVGAFQHGTDQIASFSSRGPVTYDGHTYMKPNIAAPGVGIRSSTRGGGYGYSSGTSMAAPHVAGAAALLLSAAPGFVGKVDAIQQVLTRTAEPRTTTQECGGDGPDDVPNNVWGWGIVDAFAAVHRATAGSLEGMVTEAENGLPIGAASVRAVLVPGTVDQATLTDPGGQYTLTLAAGSYDVTADIPGYLPTTVSGISVTRGQTTTLDLALRSPEGIIYLPFLVRD